MALFLALCPRIAVADPTAEGRAVKLIEGGISLLKAEDLDGARAAFIKARDLVPDKANPYRFIGLVEARLGRCAEAVAALETFLARVPQSDPRTVEAITVRDRCRDEVTPKLGSLDLETTPPGAELRLDDESSPPRGLTPYRDSALPVGAHVVYLHLEGYEPASRGFAITNKQTTRLHLNLKAAIPSVAAAAAAVAAPSSSAVFAPVVAAAPAPALEPPPIARNAKPVEPVAAIAPVPAALTDRPDLTTAAPLAPLTPASAARGRPRYWIIGVVVAVVAVAGVGAGLGIAAASGSETVLNPVNWTR